jgi:hypothetical protein
MENNRYVISFNEDIKGWTSFHPFVPDWMISMNSQFYSFKNGNLYKHFDPAAPRNTFYGIEYPSKISVMVNASPSVIKELQVVGLEGNLPWDMIITAYVSDVEDFISSTIDASEFEKDEGLWSTYARRNEDANQTDSSAVYGIGRVNNISGTTIVVNGFSDVITIGDKLFNVNLDLIGTIQSHSRVGNETTIVLNTVNNLSTTDFVLGGKDVRIEGGNLRGYTIRFDLEINSTQRAELFALNAEVIKSFQS